MGVASIVLGIIGLLFTLIGLIPLLGIILWFAIPILAIGLVLGIIAITKNKTKGTALAGTIICGIFLLIGIIRLAVGAASMAKFARPISVEKLEKSSENLKDFADSLNKLNEHLNK